jgi:periplasmic copper chaperone A
MGRPAQTSRRVRRVWRVLGATALAACLHAGAQAASVEFNSAWMRPALAGQAARAYVDIKSDTTLVLTAASAPVARAIEFVMVGGIAEETVVATVPIPSGTPVRLAFRGNHLRLVDVTRDIRAGEQIPVTLSFADAEGRVIRETATVIVRGVTAPAAGSDPRRP